MLLVPAAGWRRFRGPPTPDRGPAAHPPSAPDQRPDLLGQVESRIADVVELYGRDREYLLHAHHLLDHTGRHLDPAEVLVLGVERGHVHLSHGRGGLRRGRDHEPGLDAEAVEALAAGLPHEPDLVAIFAAECGLLYGLDGVELVEQAVL